MVAKGMSSSKHERDIVLLGFREQLDVVEQSQVAQEEAVKAKLYDIITNSSACAEEIDSIKNPYLSELENIYEKHIRIRRAIFIGLYSFLEVSLADISKKAKSIVKDADTMVDSMSKKAGKVSKGGVADYLKLIYKGDLPEVAITICNNIKELRNYMVHGSMNDDRENAIKSLIQSHPELHIIGAGKEYNFSDYDGIKYLINMFEHELNNAENKVKH